MGIIAQEQMPTPMITIPTASHLIVMVTVIISHIVIPREVIQADGIHPVITILIIGLGITITTDINKINHSYY